jgi:3-hydroxyacyl-CoA dehydrogenase
MNIGDIRTICVVVVEKGKAGTLGRKTGKGWYDYAQTR